MTTDNYDVVIIGAGAAGCAAAVFAAQKGEKTAIVEPGLPMHKLSITGKGRCNLTNNCDIQTFLANVKTNPRFLLSALNNFTPQDTMAFFEDMGVKLKTERGGRVFPVSDDAGEVVKALKKRLDILGVEFITDRALSVIVEGDLEKAVKGVKCRACSVFAPKVILATGGMSYPKTGSTGDGYKIAAACGHKIISPRPALVPIITRENCADLAGLTLKNVRLSLYRDFSENAKHLYSEQGELLFTHFGISGPLALTASCYIDEAKPYLIKIDLKPALDSKKLDTRVLRDFSENKNKLIRNVLAALVPKSLILAVLLRANILPDKPINLITSAERGRLVGVLKGFGLTVAGLRPIDEAVITDGGVDVREINPKTMESKLIKGLHFTGEVMDVAGFTGGFNLQIAFSTANAAAKN